MVSKDGISIDQFKVKAIKTRLVPKSIFDVWSFHGLAYYYWRFVKNFSTLIIAKTECMKNGSFEWSKAAQNVFEVIKQNMCESPILALPDFNRVFEVECDER